MIGKISKLVLIVFVVLGCTQFASAVTITVGASGADYTDFATAISAVSTTGTTIQFIDSGSYGIVTAPSLTAVKYEGLTIESAVGQKATITLDGAGGFGFLYGKPNMTLQNVKVVNNGRDAGILGDGNATGMVVKDVDFVCSIEGANNYLLGAAPGMEVSYSTFYGFAPGSTGAAGISVYLTAAATIDIDHCSFDNLGFAPIRNGAGAIMTVTNSLFGNYRQGSTYRKAIYVAGTLTEDYNAYYEELALAWHESAGGYNLPDGPNTMNLVGYTDIFAGTPSTGDWEAAAPLHYAASDGTTIGAWQIPEPATMSLLIIGGVALLRRKRS